MHAFWLQPSCQVLHAWSHVSLTHEIRLNASLSPEPVFLSLYHTFSFDCVHSMPKPWLKRVMGSGNLSLGIWCCNPVFTLHLLLIMDRSWVLSLALSLSIGRVGNDPNPTQEIAWVTGLHACKGPCKSHRGQTCAVPGVIPLHYLVHLSNDILTPSSLIIQPSDCPPFLFTWFFLSVLWLGVKSLEAHQDTGFAE